MEIATFRASLTEAAPPAGLPAPLMALWWLAGGDWNKAHLIAQGDDGAEAAWVHAHLHRVEGDLGNARYWYARAGRAPTDAPLPTEWTEIVASLLAAG
jgi:hypothetical protein